MEESQKICLDEWIMFSRGLIFLLAKLKVKQLVDELSSTVHLCRQMSCEDGVYVCGDSWCSRCLVSCSNSHIIHAVMVVGPRWSVSLTGVMMLPRRRQTRGLMDRSRCPAPLTSPKRSHVWNWFCRFYLPVGLCSLPLSSFLSVCLSQQDAKYFSS